MDLTPHFCLKLLSLECGENEYYTECHSNCDPKCDDPHAIFPCIAMCRIGCACKEGYARDANNKCTKFADCPGYLTSEIQISLTEVRLI
jgi:hypothetical protein